MENKDKEILLKILKHVHHAINYASKHTSLESFQNDEMCVEATVFNLMQIGELAKTSLSEEFKKELKSIPWNQIYGFFQKMQLNELFLLYHNMKKYFLVVFCLCLLILDYHFLKIHLFSKCLKMIF